MTGTAAMRSITSLAQSDCHPSEPHSLATPPLSLVHGSISDELVKPSTEACCGKSIQTNGSDVVLNDNGYPASWDDPITRPRPANDPSVIERFKKYVKISTDRFWTNPETRETTPCHEWCGGKSRGQNRWSEKAFYGTFNPGGEVKGGVRAHVFIAWVVGLIPTLRVPLGMNIDHRCSNSLCVNTDHFEVVPWLVNQHRRMLNRG